MNMSLLTKFLALYSKSGLRGTYRLTDFLSHRFKSLQCVPIQTESGTLYIDLRISSTLGILANPKTGGEIYGNGEDKVMRNLIQKRYVVY